ncbi:hypothetical protein [Spirosoma sordidisoli]|uniref:Uncharacterized protein n=1 Tax=Spirosoma sordidisoli TaxID=2502893 RepID=A0A4Q2UJG8_9BACT|nr:hypothetical protein [Spirosoma sordidisoli]RYC69633.1 hypothetical protein EQG79_13615 [Spirosoma sordidisoli]
MDTLHLLSVITAIGALLGAVGLAVLVGMMGDEPGREMRFPWTVRAGTALLSVSLLGVSLSIFRAPPLLPWAEAAMVVSLLWLSVTGLTLYMRQPMTLEERVRFVVGSLLVGAVILGAGLLIEYVIYEISQNSARQAESLSNQEEIMNKMDTTRRDLDSIKAMLKDSTHRQPHP